MTAPDRPSDIRAAVREAMIGHVPFDGWSWAAFDLAVADAGVDRVLARDAFPNGPADVLADAAAAADAALLAEMGTADTESDPTERLKRAVRLRLDHNAGREDAVRRGLAFLATPGNATLGVRLLMRTADAIRTAAGDGATGLRGMARRNALAGAYSATLLVWLEDSSEGRETTWAFLDRRLRPLTGADRLLDSAAARAEDLPRRLRQAAPARLAPPDAGSSDAPDEPREP